MVEEPNGILEILLEIGSSFHLEKQLDVISTFTSYLFIRFNVIGKNNMKFVKHTAKFS